MVNTLPHAEEYSKTLGLEWNSHLDLFRITVSDLPHVGCLTKRALVSDVAKVFDALGWFAPTTVKMKILLQKVWELRIGWDKAITTEIQDVWHKWRYELPSLSQRQIPHCYFPPEFHAISTQLHDFCDASKDAYAGVVYLRFTDDNNNVHISLVASKTKVSPIKRLTIPRLELCGAHLLSKLFCHVQEVLSIPLCDVFGWTDSTIVLHWMAGDSRRFKTYVGNRISDITDRIPPEQWRHVKGVKNPADCSSRGLFPEELVQHPLWWNGPPWLHSPPANWPSQALPPLNEPDEEVKGACLHTVVEHKPPVMPYDQVSSFSRLKRITAWVLRFVCSCWNKGRRQALTPTVDELNSAEHYWISLAQHDHFSKEIQELTAQGTISATSSLVSICPLLESRHILRVGGRQQNSGMAFSRIHPVILHKKHPLT